MAGPRTFHGGEAAGSSAEHAPALRRYFQRRIMPCDVDDLVQETLLSLQARKSTVPIDNPQGYLFTIASHVLAKYRQREARLRDCLESVAGEASEAEEISPERTIIGKDGLDRALALIEDMPTRTRDIFVLHRFEDMTYSAIARRHAISVSAVEKHIMAALRILVRGMVGR